MRRFFQTLLIFIVVLGITGPMCAMEKKPLSQEEIIEKLTWIMEVNDVGQFDVCLFDDTYEEVKKMIAQVKDINTRNSYGETLLHAAADGGRYRVAKFLLDSGIEMEAEDTKTGATALHMAFEHGHYAVARLLLEKGANPHATFESKRHKKYTPLKLAQERLDELEQEISRFDKSILCYSEKIASLRLGRDKDALVRIAASKENLSSCLHCCSEVPRFFYYREDYDRERTWGEASGFALSLESSVLSSGNFGLGTTSYEVYNESRLKHYDDNKWVILPLDEYLKHRIKNTEGVKARYKKIIKLFTEETNREKRTLAKKSKKERCCKCQKSMPIKELFRCARCKNVLYCSQQCQITDWSQHKKECKPYVGKPQV